MKQEKNQAPGPAAHRGEQADNVSYDSDAQPEGKDNQLEQETLQKKYRQAYLEQLRRMSCPGCGETEPEELM